MSFSKSSLQEILTFPGVDIIALNFTEEQRATSRPRGSGCSSSVLSPGPQDFQFGQLAECTRAPSWLVNLPSPHTTALEKW